MRKGSLCRFIRLRGLVCPQARFCNLHYPNAVSANRLKNLAKRLATKHEAGHMRAMHLQTRPTKSAAPKKKRGQRKHIWAAPHRRPSKSRTSGITTYDRAAQLAFPWAPEDYPGLLRGMANLLGGRAAVRTIIDWRRGRYHPPLWAIEVLQEALKVRVKTMTESIEELEKEKTARLTAP